MPDGITTILPVFFRNHSPVETSQLDRAIESVLSQECGIPHELLIVDDGSPTPLTLQRADIRVIRLLRNHGVSYALNAGLTQARYSLIARIDADDIWRPGKLATQLALLEADPDLTLVASGMRLVHPNHPERNRDELRGSNWPEVLALTERIGCPFPHGSMLARREIFELLGGYPQAAALQHAEDFALWSQWIRFFKVSICDEIFLDYTISERQISARFAQEQQQASAAAGSVLDVLKDRTRNPEAVQQIATAQDLSLLDASHALFTAWKYYSHILVDPAQFEAAAALFPDRAVHRVDELDTLRADRFFYLHRGPVDHRSARLIATI